MPLVIPATTIRNTTAGISYYSYHNVSGWWSGRNAEVGDEDGGGGRGGGGGLGGAVGSEETGGDDMPWYLHQKWRATAPLEPSLLTVVGVIMSAIGLAGMIGNLGVLFLLCRYKKLQSTANMYVFNLALADLLMCVGNFPMLVISCYYGRWTTGYSGCKFYSFIGGLTGFVSINTLTAMACDRYNVIYHEKGLLRTGSKNHSLGVLFSLWIYSLFWAIPPFFGWGRFTLDGGQISCCFDYLNRGASNVSYIVAIFVFCFGIQVLVILFCYVNIVMTVRQQGQSLKRANIGMLLYQYRSHSYELTVHQHLPTAVAATATTTTTISKSTTAAAAAADASVATPTASAAKAAALGLSSKIDAELEQGPASSPHASLPISSIPPDTLITKTTTTTTTCNSNSPAINPITTTTTNATTTISATRVITAEQKLRATPTVVQGQGKGRGQERGEGHDQGHRQGKGQGQGQGQGQEQEQEQSQGHEQQKQSEDDGQGQGQRQHQGLGKGGQKGQEQDQRQGDGRGQEQVHVRGQGQGREQERGQGQGQGVGRRRRRRRKTEVQVMRMVCLITLFFLVAWMPFAVVSLIGVFGDSSLLTPLIALFPGLIGKATTVVNPLLYAIGHPHFRRVVLKRYRRARNVAKRKVSGVEANGRTPPVPTTRDILSSMYFATVLGSPDSHHNPTQLALQLQGTFSSNHGASVV